MAEKAIQGTGDVAQERRLGSALGRKGNIDEEEKSPVQINRFVCGPALVSLYDTQPA